MKHRSDGFSGFSTVERSAPEARRSTLGLRRCSLLLQTVYNVNTVFARDENGRKRSVNTKTVTVFIFFIGNEIGNGNSGNENDIGTSETSETKVRYGKYGGNGQNLKFDR
jgi:hypothetical protein